MCTIDASGSTLNNSLRTKASNTWVGKVRKSRRSCWRHKARKTATARFAKSSNWRLRKVDVSICIDVLGYPRKYPPPPPPPNGRHWIGYLKISGFPRRTSSVFTGFRSLLIQNLEEFQNFPKIWMVSLEFRLKFTTFWGNLWISSRTHWPFLTGFPVSSMGRCGYFLE